MHYIDLHCDTLSQALIRGKKSIYELQDTMLDIKRLQHGGALAQFFAIFMPPAGAEKMIGHPLPEDDEYIRLLCEILENSILEHPEAIAKAGNTEDLLENKNAGKISAFLTLEDGRSVEGNMEKLERYEELGIRLISLTWNAPNCIGFQNSRDSQLMRKGLTSFGKEMVERMGELGMIVDVSHLSDGGFADVSDICRGPFVASHSNCRALCPHPRNLTDEMIHIVGEHGGVAGLNFGPEFLNSDIGKKESRMAEMTAHLRHMIKCGGEDCVAIGTDFDGIKGEFEIGSSAEMPMLFEHLVKEGFTKTQIEKLAFRNAERVIREVMK